MVYSDVIRVVSGQLPAEEFVSPLSASLMYFVITMGVGVSVRFINNLLVPEPLKTHIANFSATLEMCAYFFENNFIYSNYGSTWLFIAVVLECFIANRTFFGASENPCQQFVQFMEGNLSALSAMTAILVQTVAGVCSYKFARLVWSLDMVPDHRGRYLETACDSDLHVALMLGIVIEFGATLIDTWLGRQVVAKQPVLDELIKLANGSFMIVLGINMTGMYFNPAMATGHLFGCRGAEMWEFLFVYWAGPLIGCYGAVLLDKMIHLDVVERAKDQRKKRE